MSENKNFMFKVPKTKANLIKEILKRWWYAKEFKEQAKRAFGISQIKQYIPHFAKKDIESKEDSPVMPPETGKV